MSARQKKDLIRIIISAFLLILLNIIPIGSITESIFSRICSDDAALSHLPLIKGYVRLVLFLIPYAVVGYDILIKAGKGIKNLRPLDENFLMALATLGAFAINIYEDFANADYNEAVAVMLFYQIGELFEKIAVGKSRKNIAHLMDIRPDYANIERDGKIVQVPPDDVSIGDIIIARPGEKIPIDGVVTEGESVLDTSALTGESLPRNVSSGDEVISGCINMTGVIKIKTEKEFGQSTVSKILELVENAGSRKSRSEEFISKFARIYTPIVVGCAVALAVILPLFRMLILKEPAMWEDWIYRALTFLVISCPCALVISIPLSFFAGIGGASREGILIKGSNYLEALAHVSIAVFDKTGTLTKGQFGVSGICNNDIDKTKLLEYAAYAESSSSHPIAQSIKKAYAEAVGITEADLDLSKTADIQELSGMGVIAKVDGHSVAAGNLKLMSKLGIEADGCKDAGTVIYMAVDGAFKGYITISDMIKESSREAIAALESMGVSKTVMLTGDADSTAHAVAEKIGISDVYSELLPADKVEIVEKLLKEKEPHGKLAFTGDGINDAPVLARADIGIAMGAMGADAAIEAADVVLMDDDPMKIAKAMKIARKCMRIVYENIWFALGIKLVCLVLGALGIANLWLAVFADVGVMVIAVFNAVRALHTRSL